MKKRLLALLLLPAACGQPGEQANRNDEAVRRGIERSVADVQAAEQAAAEPQEEVADR